MLFEGAGYSNVGRTRESNQDSYLIKVASTPVGDVALVAVADGMGGLECGELASAAVINMLSDWFDNKLPVALEAMESSVGGFESFVDGQWGGLIQDMNMALIRYGMAEHMNLGTTLTAMLAIGGRYSIVHVGDTRAYELTESQTNQLTVDQTFVRREVEAGRITPEEALTHPRRNAAAVPGSTKEVVPDLIHGTSIAMPSTQASTASATYSPTPSFAVAGARRPGRQRLGCRASSRRLCRLHRS
ncbi:MAG: PP2C family protein-serine/threonine phosphatase [Collinsella sp.]